MTLWNDLKDFFNSNRDAAQEAMHGEDLWGSVSWWGENKGEYAPSKFETWAKVNNVGRPSLVDNYRGEDMGSSYYAVHKFTRDGEEVFIRFRGFYASYDGADYEGFDQVFPREVTKIEYI
jgi:hypothetical protein